jgi:WD40 repeat protein
MGHKSSVNSVAWSSDESVLFSSGWDKQVHASFRVLLFV